MPPPTPTPSGVERVGEGYECKAGGKNGIASVQKNAADAKIEDLTEQAPPLPTTHRVGPCPRLHRFDDCRRFGGGSADAGTARNPFPLCCR